MRYRNALYAILATQLISGYSFLVLIVLTFVANAASVPYLGAIAVCAFEGIQFATAAIWVIVLAVALNRLRMHLWTPRSPEPSWPLLPPPRDQTDADDGFLSEAEVARGWQIVELDGGKKIKILVKERNRILNRL